MKLRLRFTLLEWALIPEIYKFDLMNEKGYGLRILFFNFQYWRK
jgi:hypothetical protein